MFDSSIIVPLLAGIVIGAGGFYFFSERKPKTPADSQPARAEGAAQLQLQSYERLTLLVDRIALPNLISRVNQPGLSAKDMQLLLTRSIKEEFDYNITQQVYVSADAWNAVKNLKEQNMLVVNQLANTLPPDATGLDLNKLLLEYLMTDKKGNLHEVVSEVLSYEAKRLL